LSTALGEATRRLQFFVLANLYMLIISVAMDVYNKGIPVSRCRRFST